MTMAVLSVASYLKLKAKNIHSPQKFLSEIRRVLAGDGLLIVDMTLGDGVYESFAIESYKAGISLVENNGFLFDAKNSGITARLIENYEFEMR